MKNDRQNLPQNNPITKPIIQENISNSDNSSNYDINLSKGNIPKLKSPIDFKNSLAMIKRRLGIIALVTAGITTGVAFWTYSQKPIYEGKFNLLVENSKSNQYNSIQKLEGNWEIPTMDYETQKEILSSPNVLMPIMSALTKKYPTMELEDLEKIKIEQINGSQVLKVTYQDNDPEKIKFVLDQVSEVYLNFSSQQRKGYIQNGLKFIDGQLPPLIQKKDSLQTQLQKFRQQNNIINPENYANELSKQSIEIEKIYLQSQVDLKQATSIYNTLEKQLNLNPDQAIAISYLTESPRYQNLLKQLQDVEVELALQSAIYTDKSPQILSLKEKKENVSKLLAKETKTLLKDKLGKVTTEEDSISLAAPSQIRTKLTEEFIFKANEIKMLEMRQNSLNQVLNDLDKRLRQMPGLARKYNDLQTEINLSTTSINRFREAKEKLQLEEVQKPVNWQIIAPPKTPKTPIYPLPLYNLILGLISGLGLGFIAAMIAEKLDSSIHTVAEIKELSEYPLLGYIPVQKNHNSMERVLNKAFAQITNKTSSSKHSGKKKTTEDQTYTVSYWLESFRNLYTNVNLLGSNNPVNSLVISSPSPGDGKSTISLHLAQAAAAMGQKVLLIDADLRLPQIHLRLDLENEVGLSNILAKGLSLEEAIQEFPQWDNLSIITAGKIPPDPTRLLYSKNMKQFMEKLQENTNYDLIIFDTPPILAFADAKIIAPSTNGVILVTKIDQTERNGIENAIELLELSKVTLLGLIANGIRRDDDDFSYQNSRYNQYMTKINQQLINNESIINK